jgi:predicted permease
VNTALFSVVDRVYFQAPPGVVDPGSVRRLIEHGRSPDGTEYAGATFTTSDHSEFIEAGSGEVEGYHLETQRAIGETKRTGVVSYATQGFFHLAGVRPYRGRFFTSNENVYGAPVNVAVLSHSYWNRALGADSAVLGTKIRIDTSVFTIVGIAPPRFEGLDLDAVDVWVPLAAMRGREGPWWNGDFGILQLFVRLPSGLDRRAAEGRFSVVLNRVHPEASKRDPTRRIEAAPLLEARTAHALGRQSDRNLALMIRLVGVGLLVLVIAVSNVASLLLMRALRRRREIAIRIALGVSRRRLTAQMMIESLLLAAIGGAGAVLIAFWAGGPLRNALLSSVSWTATVVDARLVIVAGALAVMAGATAGLVPATIGLRRDVLSALKAGSVESGRARSSLRVSLLVTQTALCMLMLAAAGMFVQSLQKARDFDLGFDADRLISVRVFGIPPDLREPTSARIRALPSVTSIGGSDADFGRAGMLGTFHFSNGDSIPLARSPFFTAIDTAYAHTTGMRVLAGRFFSREDRKGAELVVLINEAMASEFWRGRNPVGDCVSSFMTQNKCARIIGVVSNERWYVTEPPHAILYGPGAQSRFACCGQLVVRTDGRATATTVEAIQQILNALPGIDPDFAPTPRLVADRLEPHLRPFRVAAGMFLLFGLLALAAASAGIYGLVGYDVTQRTRELGVRIALGATSSSILQLVIGSGVRVVAIGLVVGVASALGAGRIMSSLLFETSPYDPTILTGTAVTLSVVALMASLVPAWKATRVDPVVALRSE